MAYAYDPMQSLAENLRRFYVPSDGTPESGGSSTGDFYQRVAGPIETAFGEASYQPGYSGQRGDYGGERAFNLITQLGPNATWEQINAAIQQQGLRPFSSQQDWQARNTALPGNNVSFSPFNPIDVIKGVGETASDLWSEPGFRALALTAAGGSLMGPGTTPAVGAPAAAPAAADASLAGLIESGAVGTAGGALEAGALTGGVDYASLLAGTAPGSVATTGGIAAATGLSPEVLRLLGIAGVTGLGMYGANKQADSLRDIAAASEAKRAPFYNKSIEYLNNPEAYISGPGKSSLDATLRALSARHGNPIGSPTALGIATEAGLRDWRDAVTGFGNMGLSGEDARMNIQGQATGADANVLNALGYGLGQVTNPQTTLEQLLRGMRGGSLSLV
jgi:hypothetical protein